MLSRIKGAFKRRSASRSNGRGGRIAKILGVVVAIYLLVTVVLGMFWSTEPDPIQVRKQVQQMTGGSKGEAETGVATTATVIAMAQTLLHKSGGYITNDIFPPGLWMDNMHYWEFGVLVQLRDITRAMRRDMSRSQSQSAEDKDLIIAEPQLSFDNNSWILPSTESEYRKGIRALKSYLNRLQQSGNSSADFYARTDSLRSWLGDAETRLGSLSRRLSESVGKQRVGETTTGSAVETAGSDTEAGDGVEQHKSVKTPWTKLDDVFYEARGTSWALLNLFRAIKIDFRDVLIDKKAMVSLKQVIIELEGSQESMWSPVILNGSGFGILANHSLTMASYLARANAAISDLRRLLNEG